MRSLRVVVACLAASLAAGLLLSCGYHLTSKGASLPSHVKKIGVPAFGNSTSRPELGQRVTDKIIQRLVERGKYTVTTETHGVDAVLSGTVEAWTSRPVELSQQESDAKRVAVTLKASVKFEDLVEHRVLWQDESYAFTAEYDVIGDPEQYFDTELSAVEEVADDFSRAVVSAILQGF